MSVYEVFFIVCGIYGLVRMVCHSPFKVYSERMCMHCVCMSVFSWLHQMHLNCETANNIAWRAEQQHRHQNRSIKLKEMGEQCQQQTNK